MLEKDIKNEILDYLSYRKDVFVFPIDSVGIFDPKKKIFRRRHSKHYVKGVADILGINDRGRLIAIEVKSKTGQLRPEQKVFLQKIQDMGGIAFVARSLQDVIHALERFWIT